ncbi:MAG: CpsB/CapC family capsule biosynthesis tyrosine phosphatase [Salibacteraceae bacterium]
MFGKLAQIFKKKEEILDPLDLGKLQVDVHSHFIPGIDDGAKTMEDSLELIKAMKDFGYRKVITTPHVMSDYYRNSSETIIDGKNTLQDAVDKAGINIEIECAAEYYLDADLMPKIKNKELLTFGESHVLFELPFMSEPPNLAEVIFEMQLAGYKPVLAHPERYAFWHLTFEKYQELHDKGVILQLNMNSLTGHYSPEVKKVSKRLVEDGLISLVGSDCHHIHHIGLMQQASKLPSMHALVNSGKLLNNQL